MSQIYIVNHTVGGYYVDNTQNQSYYLKTEVEAQDAFDDALAAVDEDPSVIELIRLDTETLDATTLRSWAGTIDDLDDDEEEEGEA